MKRRLNAIIFGVIILILFNSSLFSEKEVDSKNFAFDSLPYWITDTYSYPIQPVFVTFAYNRIYDREKQTNDAIFDIALLVSIYKSVDLEYQYIDIDNYLIMENEEFNEYFDYFYDKVEASNIISNIVILESYETKDGYFYLGYDTNLTTFSYDLVHGTLDGVPEWTKMDKIPFLKGYTFGVNSYPFYRKRSLEELIESADHSAFMKIIYQTEIRTKYAHLDTQINDSGLVYHKSSVTLTGLHVIGRYIDEKNSRIYSLVVVPENTYKLK